MPEQLESNRQSENPSILAGISPIFANSQNQLVLLISNLDERPIKLVINDNEVDFEEDDEGVIPLKGVSKQFRYSVLMRVRSGMIYETEGAFN